MQSIVSYLKRPRATFSGESSSERFSIIMSKEFQSIWEICKRSVTVRITRNDGEGTKEDEESIKLYYILLCSSLETQQM